MRRVAILGAGIMGASLAIFLARRGASVTVFDREDAPVACASRWNEGKIHLGYIYGADPTLATAQHLLPGGLLFADCLRELIGTELHGHVTAAHGTRRCGHHECAGHLETEDVERHRREGAPVVAEALECQDAHRTAE